ncbi:hypothetical protein PR048_007831 [Dryococelus australis]|uniref:Uncharacterized protein n=1 Tax=Dryococelus australis TaxID=614101 RepID=A0ABQ9HVD3_9NEOP|nr:hypothetical protein PR048_007831 [Dryococelus australis]
MGGGGGKREIPEKGPPTNGTIPTCENPVSRPGIEPGSPWWEASVLIAQPPCESICSKTWRLILVHTANALWLLSLLSIVNQALTPSSRRIHKREHGFPDIFDEEGKMRISALLSSPGSVDDMDKWRAAANRGGVVVRLLASHLGNRVRFPAGYAGIGPDDAAGRRVSSGISDFHRRFIPALLHTHFASSPSSTFKTPMLRDAEISSFTHSCATINPPTKANRVRFPAGSLPDFRMWKSCRIMLLVGGFSRGSPVPPPFHFDLLHTLLASPLSDLKTPIKTAHILHSLTPIQLLNIAELASAFQNYSPPTKVYRVRFPEGQPPNFRMWEPCRTVPLVSGFSRGYPVSLAPASRVAPYSSRSTLIDSQYLVVKSRPNLFTHSNCRKAVGGKAGDPREKARRTAASPGNDSHLRKSGDPAGSEPGSPRWEASVLIAQPSWPWRLDLSPLFKANRVRLSAGKLPDFLVRENSAGRVSSGISRFPRSCIPALLHTDLASGALLK